MWNKSFKADDDGRRLRFFTTGVSHIRQNFARAALALVAAVMALSIPSHFAKAEVAETGLQLALSGGLIGKDRLHG